MTNYTKSLVVCVVLGATAQLFACAHVERAGFDTAQHTVRYCGNKHADEADVESTARHECSLAKHFAVLRCEREQVGAKAATVDYGSGVAITNSRATYGVCCDFECGN